MGAVPTIAVPPCATPFSWCSAARTPGGGRGRHVPWRARPVVRATPARPPELPPARDVVRRDGSRHTVWSIPEDPEAEARTLSQRTLDRGGVWCAEYCDAAASRSAESTAPVHGRLGAPYCAPVFLLCFGGDRTDRAGAGAAQRAIAAHLAIPCCDRIVGQRGMSTCVAYLHRGVVVFVSGSRGLHI